MYHRRDLSLSEKNEILKKYDALPKCSQRQAALKLSIPQSSLNRILHQRNTIYTDISLNCNTERKRKRSGKDFIFGDFLLQFCEEYIQKNGTVSRGILIKKAEELAKEFGLKDFKATDGWLNRWKQRNNIILNKEKNSEHAKSAQNWTIENIPSILKNYTPDKIYNTDVAELNIHAYTHCITKLKSNTSLDKEEEKVTVLLACNMIGNKKIPLVVAKCKYLNCFKGIKTLPVQYENSEDALITREIFVNYLLEWDRELGYEKIVLILDCSFGHFKDLSLRNIKMIFLPSDIATIIHPLEQGIIKTFKLFYRKNIQIKVNAALSDGQGSVEEILEKLTLLDVMHLIANAWLNVSAACIYNSFKKVGFHQTNSQLESLANRLKEESEANKELYVTPNLWPSTSESDSLEETSISIPEPDVIVTEAAADGNVPLEETHINDSNKIDDEIKGILKTSTEIIKEMEVGQNISVKSVVPTAKETRDALHIIRKTLEQRGASIECYEVFYKMENEVCKLLQKTDSGKI